MGYLKRRDQRRAEGRADGPTDPWMAQRFPALWEWMTKTRWDDGEARQTATLLVFADEDCLKAVLHDREDEEDLWATGEGMEDLFAALEAMLAHGTGEWRKNRKGRRKK